MSNIQSSLGVMFDALNAMPNQCRQAWDIGLKWQVVDNLRYPERVVIAGIGSSSLGAEIVVAATQYEDVIPIEIWRGSGRLVLSSDTLLIATSFSGDAIETVEAYIAAGKEDCIRLAITSGGLLAGCAEHANEPMLCYAATGPSRNALGFVTFPLLAVLGKLGILSLAQHDVEQTISDLESRVSEWSESAGESSNQAKRVARNLKNSIPVVVSGASLAVAADRWQTQINENAKQFVIRGTIPGMLHNLVEAVTYSNTYAIHGVVLESSFDTAMERAAVEALLENWDGFGVTYDRIQLTADSHFSLIMQSCFLADWTSIYMAELRGADASRTDTISQIRSQRDQRYS